MAEDRSGRGRTTWLVVLGAMAALVVALAFVQTTRPTDTGASRSATPPTPSTGRRHRPAVEQRSPVARRSPTRHGESSGGTGSSAPATASGPALGVYAGPGAEVGAAAFAQAVGARVTYALDFLDGTTWQTLVDDSWLLQQWTGSPYRMVLGVPMLPESGGSLTQGATGAYDAEFTALAESLVAEDQGGAVLMVGWDPNLAGTPWSVGTAAEAAAYVAYWQQIVATMRAVPGARFTFLWDATSAVVDGVGPDQLYPGPADVGMVATDVFDQTADVATSEHWTSILEEPYGPDWFASLAAGQDKPFVLAKWGVDPTSVPDGAGDDPAFVLDSWRWATANHVAAVIVWDYGDLAITNGAFPQSLDALRWTLAADPERDVP